MKKLTYLITVLLALLLVGCHSAQGDEDTDSDTDSDSDTDTDTDSDTDTDTDIWQIGGYVLLYEKPVEGAEIDLKDSEGNILASTTSGSDEIGYYEFDVAPGTYNVEASYTEDELVYSGLVPDIVITDESVQADIDLCGMDWAPYIYLYPEQTDQVEVLLDPAPGTYIVYSEPKYGDGWYVTAEPSGLIDGVYGYLFYEATVLSVFQQDEGFAVESEAIMEWFAANLPNFGLNESETDDFLEYWSVNLPEANCYEIYPQYAGTIEQTMGLKITPTPDTLFRLRFLIKLTDECSDIQEPVITPFDRQGFVAVEWGVTFTG